MAPARGGRYAETIMRAPGRTAVKWLLMGLGGLIFAALLKHLGTRDALSHLKAVWPALPVMVLIEAFAKLANALGLRCLLAREGRRRSLREIFRLTLEADAVNYLLPTASLGGGALMARGLMRAGSAADGLIAVATANSTQNIAQFLLVLAGSALALAATPIPANLRPAIWVVMGLSTAIVGVFLLALFQGVFVFLSSLLRRVHIKAQYLLERAREVAALDAGMREAVRTHPADLALSTFFFACGWTVSAAEVFVVLKRLGVAFRWEQALAIHALGVFLDGVICFVPARAGSQEAGKVLAFTAVGLTGSAGLAFGLLRRAREILWALLGYALLARGGADACVVIPGAPRTTANSL